MKNILVELKIHVYTLKPFRCLSLKRKRRDIILVTAFILITQERTTPIGGFPIEIETKLASLLHIRSGAKKKCQNSDENII